MTLCTLGWRGQASVPLAPSLDPTPPRMGRLPHGLTAVRRAAGVGNPTGSQVAGIRCATATSSRAWGRCLSLGPIVGNYHLDLDRHARQVSSPDLFHRPLQAGGDLLGLGLRRR
jgi:hypothetical protein